jgi:uncharacterized membrane protein
MFSQVPYLVLDRNVPVFDAFGLSRKLTGGNKLNLLVIWLLAFCLGLLGLVTCGLGFIFVGPYLTLMVVVVYLTLLGETV